ncbi:MAG: 50S ribosomal protein L10 [Bordetella sp.]|nr:MAG: 50S ribosomal protein L10 [Bordetella sp.]
MSLDHKSKVEIVNKVSSKINEAGSVIIAEYRGLDVASFTLLRKLARDSNIYLRVIKNSLAQRAFSGTNFQSLSNQFVGPLVYGISIDPVSAAKVFVNFSKQDERLVIKAGALFNCILDVSSIKDLATMPCREELLSKMLLTMQAPIAQFMRTLNAVPTKFVRGLSLICDKKSIT